MMAHRSLFVVLLIALCASIQAYTDRALQDQVLNLPGTENIASDIKFDQFSGYLTIDSTTGKNIHYWLVTASDVDSATAPTVFWTNGGPGCSGLIGFLTEMGPFRPQADNSLEINPHAWNRIANMVYVEQPVGVGFSFSNAKSDYRTNDRQAAADNYATIQEFFLRFPEFASNPLYTTSESYGGHFMPEIAQYILEQQQNPTTSYTNPLKNFKGFAVGNPFTDGKSEYPAMFFTYWGHQLVSKPSWDAYKQTCVDMPLAQYNLTECELLSIKLGQEIGNLNPYAVDYPVCNEKGVYASPPRGGSRAQLVWMLNYSLPPHLRSIVMPTTNEAYEPCTDNYMVNYLNQESVKAAIHVNAAAVWAECSTDLHYDPADRLIPMQPVYQQLLKSNSGLNILVYSGDDDAVCGTVGTQEWIWSLGYSPASKADTWQPWMFNGQTAGFVTKFNVDSGVSNPTKFTFMTVHKAGHEVPTYVPQEAFDMFQKYLSGYWFQ